MKHFNRLCIFLMGLLINFSIAWSMDRSSLLGSLESPQVLSKAANKPNDDVDKAIINQDSRYFQNDLKALINAIPYYTTHAKDNNTSKQNALNALQLLYFHPKSTNHDLILNALNEIAGNQSISPDNMQKILQPYHQKQAPQLKQPSQLARAPQIKKNETSNFDTKISDIENELENIQKNTVLTKKEKLQQIEHLYKELDLIRSRSLKTTIPKSAPSKIQMSNWVRIEKALQQAYENIKNPQATTFALQSSGFQDQDRSQGSSLNQLEESMFYEPSENELLEELNITASNIINNLEWLLKISKIENVDEIKHQLGNIQKIKQQVHDFIFRMVQQITNIENIPVNSKRLIDLQDIRRKINAFVPGQKLDIELLITEVKAIQQITIDNIKNKDSLQDLGTSALRINAAVENLEKKRIRKDRRTVVARLKQEHEALKEIAIPIQEDFKRPITERIFSLKVGEKYINLLKQHIATLEEYVDLRPRLREKTKENIKKNRDTLEIAMNQIYKFKYPSMQKPWIMDIFDQINQAVLLNNAKLFREAIESYNKKLFVSKTKFEELNTADDFKRETIKAYAQSLSKTLSPTQDTIRKNAAQLIPPYLDQLYSYQLEEKNVAMIELEKETILKIIACIFDTPSNPYANLIKDIISSERILDIEKRHTCLLLVNKQGNFYPKLKSAAVQEIIDNIAKDYNVSSHQQNFKQQQDQFIAQAIKCLTILPTMEPILSGTLPISRIGDSEMEDYLDKIELLNRNINDSSIKEKLEKISKDILDESTKRLNVRIITPVTPEEPKKEEPTNPEITTSSSSEENPSIEEELPNVNWSDFEEMVAAQQEPTKPTKSMVAVPANESPEGEPQAEQKAIIKPNVPQIPTEPKPEPKHELSREIEQAEPGTEQKSEPTESDAEKIFDISEGKPEWWGKSERRPAQPAVETNEQPKPYEWEKIDKLYPQPETSNTPELPTNQSSWKSMLDSTWKYISTNAYRWFFGDQQKSEPYEWVRPYQWEKIDKLYPQPE